MFSTGRIRFKLFRDVPTCPGERDGSCLTVAQKRVVASIFRGAKTRSGERFYAGFPFDAGVGGAGVLFWEVTAPLVLDSGAVGTIFKVPPSTEPLTNGPGFTLGSDTDELLAQLFTSDAPDTESAMQFMTPPDASNLSELRARGARIMV